jgi:hypothetical protein
MDDLDIVCWWPYVECETSPKDVKEMSFVFTVRYLIGRTSSIIKRFLLGRVLGQYGQMQGMP